MSSGILDSLINPYIQSSSEKSTFQLLPLPWERNVLVPFLSENAVTLNYDGYYRKHVEELNLLARQYPGLRSQTLEQIVLNYPAQTPLNNVAGEALNHEFFIRCLNPHGGIPSGRLYQTIIQQFKTFENFKLQFTDRAVNHFASGWIWFVYDPSTTFLMIIDGDNAYNPIIDGYIPLLTLDVWEHAYILDYGFDKRRYVDNFWRFINWTYLEEIASDQIFGYRVRVVGK